MPKNILRYIYINQVETYYIFLLNLLKGPEGPKTKNDYYDRGYDNS